MSYVAAFRAYAWNAELAMLAARFFSCCPGARHVVLMNEERGPVEVGRFEKVAHGVDFAALGLPEHPAGRSLWYNGDYAYTHLRQALPGYDHYLIVESDVSVNTSLEPMMRDVAASGIDAVVHQLYPCLPNWHWFEEALAQPDPHVAALFAIVLSGRALDALLLERQALARRFVDGQLRRWPIVESFVPTTLRNLGHRIAEIGRYVGTEHLRVSPPLSFGDPDTHRPGTIAHPVLRGTDFARRLLGDNKPADFFHSGSVLHECLRGEALESVAPALWTSFLHHGDHHGLARLRADMRAGGLDVPASADLAWAKPARISSTCEWSAFADPCREASGANGLAQHEICAFHTGAEAEAWWMVDLLEQHEVGRVEIVNRANFGERFRCFVVESGVDGVDWTERFRKTDDDEVSGDAARPWAVRFAAPFRCRFLRIRRLGAPGFLHLRRVRVFGPVPGHDGPSPAALLAEAMHG